MTEERGLAPVAGGGSGMIRILRPVVSVQEAVQAWNEYQDLCHALLTQEDFQNIKGKQFKKKSAWRKLGNVFALSVVPLTSEKVREDPADPTSKVVYAEWTVQATAPNGRTMAGWGACSIHEPRAFEKPDHDIPATAMTRAINRAISDMIGAGEVSAEEIEAEGGGFDRSAAKVIAGGPLATPAQVKAVYVIARNERTLSEEELDAICRGQYGNRAPAELSRKEASELIDKLKSNKPMTSGGKPARTPESTPATAPPQDNGTDPGEALGFGPDPETPTKTAPKEPDWKSFFLAADKLGYTASQALKALQVKSLDDWVGAGKSLQEGVDELAVLAGKVAPVLAAKAVTP